MSKVIIYNQEENGIMAVCVPATNCGMSIEQIAEKDVPTKKFKIIDSSDLDKLDNKFRNAWTCDSKMNPKIDIKLARDIWRDRIRTARKPVLEKLDVDYMRALEANEDTTNIVKYKQELRDLPQDSEIENASSIEDLQKVWHNLLGDK